MTSHSHYGPGKQRHWINGKLRAPKRIRASSVRAPGVALPSYTQTTWIERGPSGQSVVTTTVQLGGAPGSTGSLGSACLGSRHGQREGKEGARSGARNKIVLRWV